MSITMQWSWLLVVSLPLFTDSKVAELILPQEQAAPIEPVSLQGPSQLWLIVGLIIATTITLTTIIMLLRVPVFVAKTGKKISTKSAAAAIPVVTRHRPITEKETKRLSQRIIRIFKLLLITSPFVLLLLTFFIETKLAHILVVFVGGFLALGSLLWVSLQYILGRLLNVPSDKLV